MVSGTTIVRRFCDRFALASQQSRGHDRGAVLGAYVASASLARVIGPFTSGPIYALLGAAAPFLICIIHELEVDLAIVDFGFGVVPFYLFF